MSGGLHTFHLENEKDYYEKLNSRSIAILTMELGKAVKKILEY